MNGPLFRLVFLYLSLGPFSLRLLPFPLLQTSSPIQAPGLVPFPSRVSTSLPLTLPKSFAWPSLGGPKHEYYLNSCSLLKSCPHEGALWFMAGFIYFFPLKRIRKKSRPSSKIITPPPLCFLFSDFAPLLSQDGTPELRW